MIFLNNRLKRFIYFEIATYRMRIFDPCYCATSILIGGFSDKEARLKWFSLLKLIFKGYNSINRLKKTEINSIFYV
jgi:Ser/Thr protein kinase RdoA (MazF antagonist)